MGAFLVQLGTLHFGENILALCIEILEIDVSNAWNAGTRSIGRNINGRHIGMAGRECKPVIAVCRKHVSCPGYVAQSGCIVAASRRALHRRAPQLGRIRAP
jgi:hypothetical protein